MVAKGVKGGMKVGGIFPSRSPRSRGPEYSYGALVLNPYTAATLIEP